MALNQIRSERNIDIVMCIDATSSMGPCIENVRKNAKKLYTDFIYKMQNDYNSEIAGLRIQIIVFRDLECDENGIEKSPFFELPGDDMAFERFLNSIQPRGGGDYKESGLEALYSAITTKWDARGMSDRQVIVLFTDSDAIDFTEKRNRPGYPNLVDETGFITAWMCASGNSNRLQERNKRLVMFAPANTVYDKKIQKICNRSQLSIVAPLKGMSDIDIDTIIKLLCASASASS